MATTFDEVFGGPEDSGRALDELRISDEAAAVLLFTDTVEEALLHYETDESVRAYIRCPGTRCPLCLLGSRPKQYALMAVYDLAGRDVKVLKIPVARGPGRLASMLRPHLRDPDVANKVFLIARHGYTHNVTPQRLADGADRGAAVIKAFVNAAPNLTSAFRAPTPEELADIPRIANKLDAIGGLPPAEED
jgi:hypothetical protein